MILAPSLVKIPAAGMTTRLVHIQCRVDDLCRSCLRPLTYQGTLCGVFVTWFGACDLYVVPVAIGHDKDELQRLPISARHHPTSDLAVSSTMTIHAANRIASRSAYFGQHIAEQRALKNMHCTMLFRADFDARKRFNFRQSQRGLLAVKSHQGHAQRTNLGAATPLKSQTRAISTKQGLIDASSPKVGSSGSRCCHGETSDASRALS